MTDYLSTNTAVANYAKLAFKSGGDTRRFKNEWMDQLADHGVNVTQDLNEDDILPKKILTSINDAIKNNTVFKEFKPVFNIEPGEIVFEKDENAVGALGHKTNANKTLQQTQLVSRNLFPKAIYKLQRLDHMTFLKGGALVQWVLSELPRYVINRVSQAILLGGVVNEDGTVFDAINPIVGDELASATKLAANADAKTTRDAILTDIASLNADNPTVFVNPSTWVKLVTADDSWSVAMLTGNGLALGGKIVKTTLLDDSHPYVVVDTDNYLLGFAGSGIETLSDFYIQSNSQYIESRAYVAGSLMKPGVAAYATTGTQSSGK